MNSINPNLATAVQTLQATSQAPRSTEAIPANNTTITNASPATTVTLSGAQPEAIVDYSGINAQQTVRNTTEVEQNDTNGNQTSSGLTYATSLQYERNYATQPQQEPLQNNAGNPTENLANENANLASKVSE